LLIPAASILAGALALAQSPQGSRAAAFRPEPPLSILHTVEGGEVSVRHSQTPRARLVTRNLDKSEAKEVGDCVGSESKEKTESSVEYVPLDPTGFDGLEGRGNTVRMVKLVREKPPTREERDEQQRESTLSLVVFR
jgi:hypothetical protein